MIENNDPFLQSLWYCNCAFVREQTSGPAAPMKLVKSVRCVITFYLRRKSFIFELFLIEEVISDGKGSVSNIVFIKSITIHHE